MRTTRRTEMKCRKCNEELIAGDFTRAEPISAGSQHYAFYHDSCWRQVKEERQKDRRFIEDAKNEDEEFERIARQARSIC